MPSVAGFAADYFSAPLRGSIFSNFPDLHRRAPFARMQTTWAFTKGYPPTFINVPSHSTKDGNHCRFTEYSPKKSLKHANLLGKSENRAPHYHRCRHFSEHLQLKKPRPARVEISGCLNIPDYQKMVRTNMTITTDQCGSFLGYR